MIGQPIFSCREDGSEECKISKWRDLWVAVCRKRVNNIG